MENHSHQNIAQLLKIRIAAYNILRHSFLSEPTFDFLHSLAVSKAINQFPFQEENNSIREGVNEVLQTFSKSSSLSDEGFQAIHWDYTRMFIGPSKLPAPPWESAYLNKDRLLFQEETLAVRRAYLKHAFLPKDFQHEADDHIGLELDFMFLLSDMATVKFLEKDYVSFKNLLLDQQNFLEEHLLKWTPSFCQSIFNHAETSFYRGMAKILEGYLKVDRMAIEELLEIELDTKKRITEV